MGKEERLKAVNEFVKVIANCGREFFKHKDFVAYFEVAPNGKVFFIDSYTKKRVYTHYSGRWKGFTNGGTLKSLCEALRDFIVKEYFLSAEYFQPIYKNRFHNPWGYGDDILKVREAAIKLGIAR